ncbi:ribonuclease H2 subunit C [Phymastichus coffea]|uniref:ribonuclease H2 subunit C n=1 Tax=Phymastichus coffea TaxID=108790 RepID=UPI00273AF6AA|nr:ribonuclease H2 subunit C [Phymastichus coffea]
MHLCIKKKDTMVNSSPELHLMPCKIHSNDSANVNTYFKPHIKSIDDKYLQSTFRGYPLYGTKIEVPKQYTGVTFYGHNKPEIDKMEQNMYATATFTKFTYWNYDKMPTKNDTLISALDWIDIAEALHSTEEKIVA